MGRAPCCDKANVKKGPWSPEEDAKLKSYIEKHGTGGNWIALPQKIGLKRCGKSCRLRWLNYLRPNIKHGAFSEEEDNIICSLYVSIGSRWSIIAAQLPGRTDNDIKNYWNTRLKKKLLGKQRKEHARRGSNKGIKTTLVGNGNATVVTSNYFTSHVQAPYWPEQPRSAAQITPKLYSNLEESTLNDHTSLRKLLIKLGGRFSEIRDPQIVHNNNEVITDLPYPIEGSCSSCQNPSYNREEQGVAVLSSFASQLSQMQCSAEAGTTNTNNPCEIEGVNCYSNPHRLDGLEFLLGSEIGGSYHGESISNWGEISSLVYASPSQGPSYELGVHQQDLLQECSFNEMRYTQAR